MRAIEFISEYNAKTALTAGQAEYNGIIINYESNRRDQTLIIQALSPQGKVLGSVKFFTGPGGYSVPLRTYRDLEAEQLQVNERYRGQGIAKTMYDFVKSQGYKIYRSDDQTDDGAAFWDKNRGEKEIWEDDLLDKPTGTVKSIASKHGVTVGQILQQLSKGIKVELEHTSDRAVAHEIALDHLGEYPDYYDRLEQAEK